VLFTEVSLLSVIVVVFVVELEEDLLPPPHEYDLDGAGSSVDFALQVPSDCKS
jgi:hypothetical protein